MKKHKCKEGESCCCYILGLEPNDNCPIHGDPWPPRCGACGRFMKWTINENPNHSKAL